LFFSLYQTNPLPQMKICQTGLPLLIIFFFPPPDRFLLLQLDPPFHSQKNAFMELPPPGPLCFRAPFLFPSLFLRESLPPLDQDLIARGRMKLPPRASSIPFRILRRLFKTSLFLLISPPPFPDGTKEACLTLQNRPLGPTFEIKMVMPPDLSRRVPFPINCPGILVPPPAAPPPRKRTSFPLNCFSFLDSFLLPPDYRVAAPQK